MKILSFFWIFCTALFISCSSQTTASSEIGNPSTSPKETSISFDVQNQLPNSHYRLRMYAPHHWEDKNEGFKPAEVVFDSVIQTQKSILLKCPSGELEKHNWYIELQNLDSTEIVYHFPVCEQSSEVYALVPFITVQNVQMNQDSIWSQNALSPYYVHNKSVLIPNTLKQIFKAPQFDSLGWNVILNDSLVYIFENNSCTSLSSSWTVVSDTALGLNGYGIIQLSTPLVLDSVTITDAFGQTQWPIINQNLYYWPILSAKSTTKQWIQIKNGAKAWCFSYAQKPHPTQKQIAWITLSGLSDNTGYTSHNAQELDRKITFIQSSLLSLSEFYLKNKYMASQQWRFKTNAQGMALVEHILINQNIHASDMNLEDVNQVLSTSLKDSNTLWIVLLDGPTQANISITPFASGLAIKGLNLDDPHWKFGPNVKDLNELLPINSILYHHIQKGFTLNSPLMVKNENDWLNWILPLNQQFNLPDSLQNFKIQSPWTAP